MLRAARVDGAAHLDQVRRIVADRPPVRLRPDMERDLDSTGLNLRRLAQEVAETRRRMVIGGSFYVLGWVLVCLFTPVMTTYPWASAALAALFIGLAIARVVVRPPAEGSAEVLTRWLDLQWMIIQVSAATWGGVVFWTLIDPVLEDARIALLIGAAGFATAIAHTYWGPSRFRWKQRGMGRSLVVSTDWSAGA